MASSADTVLIGVQLMGLGDKTNTWGDDQLNNVLKVLAKSSHGHVSVAVTGDTTVTETNYSTTNETENAVITLTGSLASAINYVIPSRHRKLLVYNNAGDTVTVKTAAGTGVAIPNGYASTLYCDGTDVYSRNHYFDGTVRADNAVQNEDLTTLSQVSALIAAQLTSGDGSFLVSADDTTRKFLEDGITVSDSGAATVTLSTVNPGANEKLNIDVAVAATDTLAVTNGGIQTTAFTAAVNTRYTCVFSSSGTITLPASASVDDVIILALADSSIVYTIDPNSLNMNGSTSTLVFPSNNTYILTYTGAAQGWV